MNPMSSLQQPRELMNTAKCNGCQMELSYPSNSLYIQCPQCQNTMNPQTPNTNYINCPGCSTLLSHPPTSLTIQCPQCLVVMELQRRIQTESSVGNTAVAKESRKNKKKRKDPNAPKRASNAYMIFCKAKRAELKLSQPELSFGNLGQKLGVMWREMKQSEKVEYEKLAIADRERYRDEMATYTAAGGGMDEEVDPQQDPKDGDPIPSEPQLNVSHKRPRMNDDAPPVLEPNNKPTL